MLASDRTLLLMLEDDPERLMRFRRVLALIDPSLELVVWRDAWRMIGEVEPFLPRARLLSLDHDLEPEVGATADPGTGWDVAQFLAPLPPCCPVVIHSSNGERATWMMGEFHLGGWEYHRVAPLGDDWVEAYWGVVVRRLLRRRRRPR